MILFYYHSVPLKPDYYAHTTRAIEKGIPPRVHAPKSTRNISQAKRSQKHTKKRQGSDSGSEVEPIKKRKRVDTHLESTSESESELEEIDNTARPIEDVEDVDVDVDGHSDVSTFSRALRNDSHLVQIREMASMTINGELTLSRNSRRRIQQ